MKFVVLQRIKTILRRTMAFSLLLSFSIYAWCRILFYEVPFTIGEDIPIIFKTIVLCWGMVLAAIVFFHLLEKGIARLQQFKFRFSFNKKWIITSSVILFLSAILFSCNG